MSTYDGAYSSRSNYEGARVCSCSEDSVNDFCRYHGKYRDGSFKNSEEYQRIKQKIQTQDNLVDDFIKE